MFDRHGQRMGIDVMGWLEWILPEAWMARVKGDGATRASHAAIAYALYKVRPRLPSPGPVAVGGSGSGGVPGPLRPDGAADDGRRPLPRRPPPHSHGESAQEENEKRALLILSC